MPTLHHHSSLTAAPHLDLTFETGPSGITELQKGSIRYPWHVTQPFYYDHALPGLAAVIPQSASGGMFQRDDLQQCITVRRGATARLESQGAMLVHASRNGAAARSHWNLELEPDCYFEYLGDPLVLGTGSAIQQKWNIHFSPSSVCFFFDSWTWLNQQDRPGFANYRSEITVRDTGGAVQAVERMVADPNLLALHQQTCTFPIGAFATAIILAPASGSFLADQITELRKLLDSEGDCFAGVSALPNDVGIAIKVICANSVVCQKISERLWHHDRMTRTGKAPPRRRRGF